MLEVLHDRFCVKDTALKWFESYLSDRTQTLPGQRLTITPSHSRLQCATGIGPGTTEFNAYTEDLANLIDDHHLDHHMYADDTQLIEYTTASDIPNAIMSS